MASEELNPANVPPEVAALLPLASRWGIGDDAERSISVRNATRQELSSLVEAVDGVDEEALYGWLSGPDSFAEHPTKEYLAITALTMAADEARQRLKTA